MKSVILILIFSLSASAFANSDIYQSIYDGVQKSEMIALLKNLGGVTPVTVNGQTFNISERFSPQGKAKFRAYFIDYFKKLGISSQELPYKTLHFTREPQGHNVEAVLPGKSADSIVIIVHYDSMGRPGFETSNPGIDDDMTGMAVTFETAKILSKFKGQLDYTVRFVAADYEEWPYPSLEGAYAYVKYLQALAQTQNFKIVAGIDNEQIGWGKGSANQDTFDIFSCGGKTDSQRLGDDLEHTVIKYSKMKVVRGCMGANSDMYALWDHGIPAVVYSEHDPFSNPHFDAQGGDTFDVIDQDYFYELARIGITYSAQLVGVNSQQDLSLP